MSCWHLGHESKHKKKRIISFSKLDINIPKPFLYHYETNSPSPVRLPYENNTQQQPQDHPVYVSFQSELSEQDKSISKSQSDIIPLIPPFQKNFPISIIAILGISEFSAGLIVLVLELLTFDIAFGLWCSGIYTLTGAATLVLGLLIIKIYDILQSLV